MEDRGVHEDMKKGEGKFNQRMMAKNGMKQEIIQEHNMRMKWNRKYVNRLQNYNSRLLF